MKPTIIVFGASGRVGKSISVALAERGYPIIAQGRRMETINGVMDIAARRGLDISPMVNAMGTDSDVETALDQFTAGEAPSIALSALGGWHSRGPLINTSLEDWNATLASNLTAHFMAARIVGEMFKKADAGRYLLLNGIGGLVPIAGSGDICVAGAGQRRLVEVMREESLSPHHEFKELYIMEDVRKDGESGNGLSIEIVADMAIRLLDGDIDDESVYLNSDGTWSSQTPIGGRD